MALLATKRLLTKSEIFSTVAGYSGAQDSMERMFERDKDDLRTMGIEIDVGPIDPFFEDELGYRIFPQKYSLEIPNFSPAQLALLSLAGQSWRNHALSSQSQRALRKLESVGIEIDEDVLANRIVALDNTSIDFQILWDAVLDRRLLQFTYDSHEIAERRLQPYGLTLLQGEWYIAGHDLDRDAVRIFKVRRMKSISSTGKSNSFEIPDNFEISTLLGTRGVDNPLKVKLKIRKEKAHSIRSHSTIENTDLEWDYVNTSFFNLDEALQEILWHGPDIVCLHPSSLIDSLTTLLERRIEEVDRG